MKAVPVQPPYEVIEQTQLADAWLERIDKAGRDLNDVVTDIPALDAMIATHTSPTLGWIQRHTHRRTRR